MALRSLSLCGSGIKFPIMIFTSPPFYWLYYSTLTEIYLTILLVWLYVACSCEQLALMKRSYPENSGPYSIILI